MRPRSTPATVAPVVVVRRVPRPRRSVMRASVGDGQRETPLERALRYKRDKDAGVAETSAEPEPKPPSTPPPDSQPASFVTASSTVQSRLSQRTVDLEDAASTVKEYNPIRRETASLNTEEQTDSGMQQLAANAEATNQRAEQALSAALAYSKQKRDDEGITAEDTKGLRMEALTEKLNNAKEKGVVTEVEMLTRAGDYRPKVSTWGMFPRPDNISKAYGGGRTIQKGGEMESAEARQAREDRIATAVKKYKRSAGLEVDSEVARKAEQEFSNGSRLMETGKMTMAVPYFTMVIESMPPKSRLAGMAVLQRALCWETMGKSEQAKEEYGKISRHPAGEVAKKASMMLEGFVTEGGLYNANHLDFMTQRGAYQEDMIKISKSWDYQSWNTGYTPPDDMPPDEPVSQAAIAAVALGLFAVPLGVVALLAAAK